METEVYIVCWTAEVNRGTPETSSYEDEYEVFKDGTSTENLIAATKRYEEVRNLSYTHTANLTKVLKSTDH